MNKSNVFLESNVYPLTPKTNIFKDKLFLSKIDDFAKLYALRKKYFSHNFHSCEFLTDIQKNIIVEGFLCCYANNDPCFGLEIIDDKPQWTCKCVNILCHRLNICRPDFEDVEFDLFSPSQNNVENEYNYYELNNDKNHYYEVLYLEEGDYDSSFSNFQEPFRIIDAPEKEGEPRIDVLKFIDEEESKFEEKYQEEEEGTEEDDFIDEEPFSIDDSIIEEPAIQSVTIGNETGGNSIFCDFKTVEQDFIICKPEKDIFFVDAGPGTGKTYTLIKKIEYLVCEHNIEPDSIQVLSFTNAAVNVIKTRLEEFISNGGDRGLRNVDVRTFHSLGFWLLGQANEKLLDNGWEKVDLDLEKMSYDKCIIQSIKLINKFPDIVSSWSHFIVDEIQDLTSYKASFVLSIINACIKEECGFSVFGDSCQAIYDFSNKRYGIEIKSDRFYNILYEKIKPIASLASLDFNHRQTDDLILLTKDLRSTIIKNDANKMKNAVVKLKSTIPKLEKSMTMLNEQDVEGISNGKSVCFICRNNGQILRLSSIMNKRQIPHLLYVKDIHDNFAPWIAKTFVDFKLPELSFKRFSNISNLKEIDFENYNIKEIWEMIIEVMRCRKEMINVSDFLEAVRSSRIDGTFLRTFKTNNNIVSTIHRVKGMEFDTVVMDSSFIDEYIFNHKETDEFKVLYVAATRPKNKLLACDMGLERIRNTRYHKKVSLRWYIQNNNKITHSEVGVDGDIDKCSFLENDIHYKCQNYISKVIKEGDEIKLKKIKYDNDIIKYAIIHCFDYCEKNIGYMSDSFYYDLKKLCGNKLPDYIENLFVDSVLTHIGSKNFGTVRPDIKQISKFCVWNWVNFRGMGRLKYDRY